MESTGTEVTLVLQSETSGLTFLPWDPSTLCPGFANLGFYHFAARKYRKGEFPVPVRIMSLL